MILPSLTIIKNELETYLVSQDGGNGTESLVILNTPSSINWLNLQENNDLAGRVIMSLLSVEEVAMRKNDPHFKIRDNQTEYSNPPVFLDLNIMFSAFFPDDYSRSLVRLTQVVEFFQGKSIFTLKANPLPQFFAVPNINELKVHMDFKSLNLEQLSQTWITLGGRMIPSVFYTARSVAIQRPATDEVRGIITEVHVKS